MARLLRVHFASIGHPDARLAPVTLDLRARDGSGRGVEVLVGPAGSGKTTTLRAVRRAWEQAHGSASVVGLAPSATAARELARALGAPCENTAKWLYETRPLGGDGPGRRGPE